MKYTVSKCLYKSIKMKCTEICRHQHYHQAYSINKDAIQTAPKRNKMESQTQTATVPPVLGNTHPDHETTLNNDVGNGFRLAEGNFPEPKLAPQKDVEEPEDEQSLDDRMATDEEREENRKKWEAYNASEWSRYKALKEEVESVNPDGFVKAGEAEEDGNGSRQILANMSFRNGHEVNQYLLEQLRIVLETDADRTKRVEAYNCRYFPDPVVRQVTHNDRSRECGLEA